MLRHPTTDLRRLGLAVVGVFFFYIVHDALQERAFRTAGYHFGWFMTFVEILIVSCAAAAFEWQPRNAMAGTEEVAREVAATEYIVALAFVLTVAQGTGSAALNFVNFPIKVAFKSSKLCPAMIFGVLFTGKTYVAMEYGAAILMCSSLALISLADARASAQQHNEAASKDVGLGCALLTVAVFSDALIPNLQEKVLRELQYPVGRMIVLSNAGCLGLVFLYTFATGEFAAAVAWCQQNEGPALLLLVQACSSYLGLRCYLIVVRELSGVAGVVLTSLRKVFTLVLSFLFFEKPFSAAHAEGFAVLSAGVALAAYANATTKKTHKVQPKTLPLTKTPEQKCID